MRLSVCAGIELDVGRPKSHCHATLPSAFLFVPLTLNPQLSTLNPLLKSPSNPAAIA